MPHTLIPRQIRLIALDLDGTLLDSKKALSPRNLAALKAAAAQGIEIVPTTGRFFSGMPELVRKLPFLRYAITINGAQIYDVARDEVLAREEIPLAQALAVMEYLEPMDLIYDCYVDNWGYITRSFQEKAAEFVPDPHFLRMLRVLRTPVEELKAYLRQRGQDVQKVIVFARSPGLQQRLLRELPRVFPNLLTTSSVPQNLEINGPRADKGYALTTLARHLGIPIEATMAIGDGLNDAAMLRAAGLGVAMENAHPDILALADARTGHCDRDGVAQALETFAGIQSE